MRGVAKKIRGTIEKADGSTGKFVATISEPIQCADHHDYCCVVGCPSLFEGTKRICVSMRCRPSRSRNCSCTIYWRAETSNCPKATTANSDHMIPTTISRKHRWPSEAAKRIGDAHEVTVASSPGERLHFST